MIWHLRKISVSVVALSEGFPPRVAKSLAQACVLLGSYEDKGHDEDEDPNEEDDDDQLDDNDDRNDALGQDE